MTIPLEILQAVTTIVSHGPCADGTASALILRSVLPEAEVIFVQYGTPELAALEPKPHMLFVDFSPPKGREKAFVEAGAVCLDHHRTARAVVESFGELGVFADEETEPAVSGASLAMREVWLPLQRHQQSLAIQAAGAGMPSDGLLPNIRDWARLALLAGIYDTWQTQNPLFPQAREQAEALLFWPWDELRSANFLTLLERLHIGPTLVQRQNERVDKALKGAFRFTTPKGTRVTVLQGTTDITNDAAEAVGDATDLLMGFRYACEGGADAVKIIWSCRSRGDYDVSLLARRHGGGGHRHAAGFHVASSATDAENPYRSAQGLVAAHEATLLEQIEGKSQP